MIQTLVTLLLLMGTVSENANAPLQNREQSMLKSLLKSYPAKAGCPSDPPQVEAEHVWREHFSTVCKVGPEDLPLELQDYSAAVNVRTAAGCLIAIDLGRERGTLSYIAKQPTLEEPGEMGDAGWSATSMEWLDSTGVVHKPCDYFPPDTPKTIKIPLPQIWQVLEQLRVVYAKECKAADKHELTLDTKGTDEIKAKELESSMPEQTSYSMELQVAVEGNAGTSILLITVNAGSADRIDILEQQDVNGDLATGTPEKAQLAELGKLTLVEVQPPVCCLCNLCRMDAQCTGEQRESKELTSPVQPSRRDQDPDKPKIVGVVNTTLQNRFDPSLYAKELSPHLVNRTGANHSSVQILSNGTRANHSSVQILSNSTLAVALLPPGANNLTAAAKPPPSENNHTAAASLTPVIESRSSSNNSLSFGDDFHLTVLPLRSPEDHAAVWAQSRALVEIANAEGMTLPDLYHFYDDDMRSACWRQPYDQGSCGSSWAFASLGALEKQICLRAGANARPSLSREHLIRCSDQNRGCSGGNGHRAYEDLMEIGGVLATECLPYKGTGVNRCPTFAYPWSDSSLQSESRNHTRASQQVAQAACGDRARYSNRPPIGKEWDMLFRIMYEKRFGSLPDKHNPRVLRSEANFQRFWSRSKIASWSLYSEEAMKVAILKYGAIYASFIARGDLTRSACDDGCYPPGSVYGAESWEPSEGKFVEASCAGHGHAVQVIGWGVDLLEWNLAIPYWTVENSWGDRYGNVAGHEIDPFTHDHPSHREGDCMIAGMAEALVGVSQKDLKDVKGGSADGFALYISVDQHIVLHKQIQNLVAFQEMLSISPGSHMVNITIAAGNHPSLNGVAVEQYILKSVKLRCRGRGFGYSFSANYTQARVSWNGPTREELREKARKIVQFAKGPITRCPDVCQRWDETCLTFVSAGKCMQSAHIESKVNLSALTNCSMCEVNNELQELSAKAAQALSKENFTQWAALMNAAVTAPDKAVFHKRRGSCQVSTGGYRKGSSLTALYTLTVPNGADGKGGCNQYHSAPYEPGKFANAPLMMDSGSTATVRCPAPDSGEVTLKCVDGVLTVVSHKCIERVPMNSTGFHRFLRGKNYHGIESGAELAIADISPLASLCPMTGWSKWTGCSTSSPCSSGIQTRTRKPIPPLTPTSPACQSFEFEQTRPCVGDGFCPKILMKMAGGHDIPSFLAAYTRQSTSLPHTTAGAHLVDSMHVDCDDARSWCLLTTGRKACSLYFEGYFEVKETGSYIISIEATDGRGELRFNAVGTAEKNKYFYSVTSDKGLQLWQEPGLRHRRRRSSSKTWMPVNSYWLEKGMYYGQFLRSAWSTCPAFSMTLERSSAKYSDPKVHPGAKTTWWSNMWGAVDPNIIASRGSGALRRRGTRTASETEVGDPSEIIIRDLYGGKVFGKTNLSRFAFSGEELYKLLDLDRRNPCANCENDDVELVVRSTVFIPSPGEYMFRFYVDFTYDDSMSTWVKQPNSRKFVRRTVAVKLGERSVKESMYVPTPEITVEHSASQPGSVTFQASTVLYASEGVSNKFVIPSRISLQVKKVDLMHGRQLELGATMKRMSQIQALRGDDDARISYPDMFNPLQQELQISSSKPLLPNQLLVGRLMHDGFFAHAAGRVDAGGCLSLQARVPKPSPGAFAGLAINLCNEDGSSQFLELAKITAGPELESFTQTRLGWVHIAFTYPTHLQLVRDPLDTAKWKVGYRPENRHKLAEPFGELQFKEYIAGELEVGVTMSTAEPYHYAEFYNFALEDCAAMCMDQGTQVYCGAYTTACGNTLVCGECQGGNTCSNGMCMSCPSIDQTEVAAMQCGTLQQVCHNPLGQKVKADVQIGVAPTPHHICINNSWACKGRSPDFYLAEGMECGLVTNECNQDMDLGKCPEDQVCTMNKCRKQEQHDLSAQAMLQQDSHEEAKSNVEVQVGAYGNLIGEPNNLYEELRSRFIRRHDLT